MRQILALVLALGCLAMLGCGGKVKPIAGQWSSTSKDSKGVFLFGQDGTFLMVAGNEFASGALAGTYEQTGDKITLHEQDMGTKMPVQTFTFDYKWTGADSLTLTSQIDPSQPEQLVRTGPALKTASVEALTSGQIKITPDPESHDRMLTTTCVSNVKQTVLAMTMYSTDWNDTLPSAGSWATDIGPYLGSNETLTCPALKEKGKQGGYAMDTNQSQANVRAVVNPQDTILIFESFTETIGASDPQSSILTTPRHGKSISIGFVDGHAKSR